MQCPKCKSENVRRFSIVYEEGTFHGTSHGTTENSSYENDHFSQTPLAKRCSPPIEPSPGYILGVISFLAALIFGFKFGNLLNGFWWGVFAFFVVLMTLGLFWRRILAKQSFVRYSIQMNEWQHSWVCIKCGTDFLF